MAFTFEPTKEILNPVLRRVTGQDVIEIKSFAIRTLKPGLGNPTSLGVYRVTALVSTSAGDHEVSVVVKHLATGVPLMDTSALNHWNHWRREIELFESPLVDLIPESISYPEYFGHTSLVDGTELFWNEDLGDLEKTQWSWDDCLYAAQLVAELNSIDASESSKYEWLNRTQLEGWFEFQPTHFSPLVPIVADIAGEDARFSVAFENYGPFLYEQEKINKTLHSLRQCYVHGDFNLNNLITNVGGKNRLTALDWQLFGVAAVGSELASIFNTARELKVISPSLDLFNELCSIYTSTFNVNHLENPITLNEVRLAAAAMGITILAGVGFFFHQPDPTKSDAENRAFLKEMVVDFTDGPMGVYATVLHELL